MENNILIINPEERKLIDIFDDMVEFDKTMFENGGELTPALEAIAAKNEADLRLKVDGYAAVIRNYDANDAVIDNEIKRLQALKKSRKAARERLVSYLEWQMKRFGVRELQGNTCKVSFRKSNAVEVNEEAVLKPYLKTIADCQACLPPYITLGAKVGKKECGIALDNGDPFTEGAVERVTRDNLQIK